MCIVDNAVQNRIGQSGLADHFVPGGHGKLGRDQGRFTPISFLEDFQQIEALSIIQGMGSPVIQYQQLNARQLVDEARKASIQPCKCKVLEQPRHTNVED